MPHNKPHIAIIGAGIGGLSAALSLLQDGFDVHVFEQAREINEVGAGIQIDQDLMGNGSNSLFGSLSRRFLTLRVLFPARALTTTTGTGHILRA